MSLVSFDCYSAIKMLGRHDCANVFTNNIQGFPLSLRWDSYFQFDVSLKKRANTWIPEQGGLMLKKRILNSANTERAGGVVFHQQS